VSTQIDAESALERRRPPTPIALRATPAGGLTAAPSSMDEVYRLAQGLSRSGLIRKELQGKPDDCAVIILTSLELGVPLMTGLRQIAVINGKPFLESSLMQAICYGHPDICEYIRPVSRGDAGAVWEAKRRGYDEPMVGEFTRADAERAGLLSKQGVWQQYARDMMSHRALARACRAAFPDLVGGIYVSGEYDVLDVEPMPVQAERVEERVSAAVAEPRPARRSRRKAEETVDAEAVSEAERINGPRVPPPESARGQIDPLLEGLEEP
jgi:hypothetical protein